MGQVVALLVERRLGRLGGVLGQSLLLHNLELGVELGLLTDELVTPDVGLEDRLDGSRVVTDNLLLDVENRDVGRDGNLTKGKVAKQRRFTNTVTTNETVATTVGHSKRRAGEDTVGSERDIDVGKVNVLGLALGGAREVEGVDLHEHLLVALLLLLHLDELGALVERAAGALLDLGLELGLGLCELGHVDTRGLALVDTVEIDSAAHGDGRRHLLRAHVHRLVETGGRRRAANTLGRLRLEVLDQAVHEVVEGLVVTARGAALEHAPGHLDNVVDLLVLIVDEARDVVDDNLVGLGEGLALGSGVSQSQCGKHLLHSRYPKRLPPF